MSLCRITTVQKAAKPQGKCGKCGVEIARGDGYRWWKGRYTPRYVRCLKPSCTPPMWERETNPLRAEHMLAQDKLADVLNAYPTDLAEIAIEAEALREVIGMVEEITGQLQERVEAWQGTNLENGQMSEAHQATADELEIWRSDAESVADELDTLTMGDTFSEDDWQATIANLSELPELDLGA